MNFKGKRKIIVIVVILCIVILAIVVARNLVSGSRMSASGVATQNQFIEVKTGNISSTVSETGNIATKDTVDVTAPTGIKVTEIMVETGDTVEAGQTLATLDKATIAGEIVKAKDEKETIQDQLNGNNNTLEIESLEGQKADIEETISWLEALHDNPVIVAKSDGVIDNILISEDEEITKTSSASSTTSPATNVGNGTTTTENSSGMSSMMGMSSNSQHTYTATTLTSKNVMQPVAVTTEPILINDFSTLSIQTPITGKEVQNTIQENDFYSGTITWDCSSNIFQPETQYTATLLLTAKPGYAFSSEHLPIIACYYYDWKIVGTEKTEGNKLRIVATFEKTAPVTTEEGGTGGSSGNIDGNQTGNTAGNIDGNQTGNTAGSIEAPTSDAAGATGGASGSVDSSVIAGTGSGASTYSSYEAVAFTMETTDEVTISVNIDEQDILTVENGQKAVVTLDAIADKEFSGTITKIADSAETGSGSSKYAVEITMKKDKQMKIGMSATATITTGTREKTLLIPIDALQEKDGKKYVYTQQDTDGVLSGEKEITTGLSNSESVEVLSGLEEGNTVYYKATNAEDAFTTNGMEGMGSGGNEGAGL